MNAPNINFQGDMRDLPTVSPSPAPTSKLTARPIGFSGGTQRTMADTASVFELHNEGGGEYRLIGELTFATASQALRTTATLFASGPDLRFDLEQIRRADSAGVALLIEWVRRAGQFGATIRYAHVPAPLSAMIRVSGVQELLPHDPAPSTSSFDSREITDG